MTAESISGSNLSSQLFPMIIGRRRTLTTIQSSNQHSSISTSSSSSSLAPKNAHCNFQYFTIRKTSTSPNLSIELSPSMYNLVRVCLDRDQIMIHSNPKSDHLIRSSANPEPSAMMNEFVFVPNIGWAHQSDQNQQIQVQFNDGTRLVLIYDQSLIKSICYSQFDEGLLLTKTYEAATDALPEYVHEKLKLMPRVIQQLRLQQKRTK